jgi:2,4-dienoyl-CoA reductase-like NADH-dependent reductase (Old Yellow Enzyme family)
MSKLLSPFMIRNLEFRNRIAVSPMCQYSAVDGMPNDWHLVHLGSRAVGGAGLVIAEATAVSPEGRISEADLGIWNDGQVAAFRRITDFIKAQGAVPGIQIAHAGRKASTRIPWKGEGCMPEEGGGWRTLAPSAIPFDEGYSIPREMTRDDLEAVRSQFREAARRSLEAGFEVAEIHAAHGYLLHQFLSPLSNRRSDEYGGSLENRMRLPLEVAESVREVWPEGLPVFVRISATDWVEGGWDLAQAVEFAKRLKGIGIDLIDTSTGGLLPRVRIPLAPGYQIPFAEGIRREAKILTGGLGLITEASQAEEILAAEKADLILVAREFLRDPYFPIHAAAALGADSPYPVQYARAKAR